MAHVSQRQQQQRSILVDIEQENEEAVQGYYLDTLTQITLTPSVGGSQDMISNLASARHEMLKTAANYLRA